MQSKVFNGLPAYFGGKRKLTNEIAKHFKGEVICDPFVGGCSVALKAKAMGKKLIVNDLAFRSKIIAEALIKNQTVKLIDQDVYSLFDDAYSLPSDIKFAEEHFVKYFMRDTIKFLAVAFVNARRRESPKRELLLLLLYRFIMSQRQFGSFGHLGDYAYINAGKEKELLELASESRCKKIKNILLPPLSVLLKLKNEINQAVFNNFQDNEVYQMDVFELLENLKKEKRKIDTIYLDSPYSGSLVYSTHYRVLDQILTGKLDSKIEDNTFNKKDALQSFDRLFALASSFNSRIIVSMGMNPDSEKGIRGEELLAVLQKYKPAELHYLKHNWTMNNVVRSRKNGGKVKVEGKSQSECVEYILVTK